MVEDRSRPTSRTVADGAIRGESARDVVGIGRFLEIGEVARGTISRRPGEAAVNMTLQARNAGVRSGQRKLRESRVIEARPCPTRCGMTKRAVLWQSGLHVIRVGRPGVVLQMAAYAVRACSLELPSDMAGRALKTSVHSRQSEAGESRMVEGRAEPTVHGVALLASGRKLRHLVIR